MSSHVGFVFGDKLNTLLESVFEQVLREANRVNKQLADGMTPGFGFVP